MDGSGGKAWPCKCGDLSLHAQNSCKVGTQSLCAYNSSVPVAGEMVAETVVCLEQQETLSQTGRRQRKGLTPEVTLMTCDTCT